METTETLKQFYTLGNFLHNDFVIKPLEDVISDKFEIIKTDLVGKHFYSLKITKTPTRTNYHTFRFEELQEISRKLTNGLTSLGTIPNRMFWNKYFIGGVRTISITDKNQNEYPSFTLNYLVYSDIDNLDFRIKHQILTRIRLIDPKLEVSFNHIGKYDEKTTICNNTDYSVQVDFSSSTLQKLGVNTIEYIYNNQFQRPRFFGKLFKIKNQNENINN